jgi:kumamolisin
MKYSLSQHAVRVASIATIALVGFSGHAAVAARARLIHPLDVRFAAPIPHQLQHARYLGPLSSKRVLRMNVHLAYPNPDAVHAFTDVVNDPRSPVWGHFLTPKQFIANFAPSEATYRHVQAILQRGGFRIARLSPNRKIVQVVAPADVVERFFSTRLARIELDGGEHFANVAPAVVPPELRGTVMAVSGLDNIIRFKPHIRLRRAAGMFLRGPRPMSTLPPAPLPTENPVPPEPIETVLLSGYGPPDIQTAYNYPLHVLPTPGPSASPAAHLADGTGATISIEAASGLLGEPASATDVDYYLAEYGITTDRVIEENTDGPAPFDPEESDEISLDAEQTSGQAPGAIIKAYTAPLPEDFELEDMYNATVNDPSVDVVTTSFGSCEMNESAAAAAASDDLFTQGSAEGQTMFAAAGDTGAQDCRDSTAVNYVDFPSSSPEVGSAGGTTMTENADRTIKSETGWSCDDATCDNGAGGGGVSQIFNIPSWQIGLTGTESQAYHDEPDLAMVADTNTPYAFTFAETNALVVGGTSAVAPNLAALYAEIDGYIGHRLGRASATIYGPYLRGIDPYAVGEFHDITVGDNTDLEYEVANAGFHAHTGYDDDSGWGSMNGYVFLQNIPIPTGPDNL